MSHFTVAVIQDGTKTLEELLLPYMENCCGEPPKQYMEFYEDEECEVDPDTGKRGYWQNPNAKWDWWVVGGLWSGMLNTPDGPRDEARIGDVDFEPRWAETKEAMDFWDGYVEGNDPEMDKRTWRSKQFYLSRYGTRERYVEAHTAFHTRAVVTPDGKWHEVGEMGWFGMSTESHEEAFAWDTGYYDRFLKDADPDHVITIVNCHI